MPEPLTAPVSRSTLFGVPRSEIVCEPRLSEWNNRIAEKQSQIRSEWSSNFCVVTRKPVRSKVKKACEWLLEEISTTQLRDAQTLRRYTMWHMEGLIEHLRAAAYLLSSRSRRS